MINVRTISSTPTYVLALTLVLFLSFDNLLLANNTDTSSFEYHYEQSRALYSIDIDKAITHSLQANKIAFNTKEVELIGKSHWMTGWLYRRKGDLVNAFNFYSGARKAYLKLKNWDKVEELEENLGSVAFDNRSFKTAIYRWEQRMETAQKLGEERVAEAHFDLGLAKKEEGLIGEAYQHQLKALSFYNMNYHTDYDKAIGRIHNELGLLYLKMTSEDHLYYADSAEQHFKRVLEFDESHLMQAITHHNLGMVEHKKFRLVEALESYSVAVRTHKKANRKRYLMSSLVAMGEVFYDMNEQDSSMKYLSEAIYLEVGGVEQNHHALTNDLEYDMTDELIQAVAIIDSIQFKNPGIVTENNYMLVIETIGKIKMNMLLLDKVHASDLIEIADQEMKAELERELFWANFQKWIGLVASILIMCILIFKLTQWYLSRKAISKSLKETTKHFEHLLNKKEQ